MERDLDWLTADYRAYCAQADDPEHWDEVLLSFDQWLATQPAAYRAAHGVTA